MAACGTIHDSLTLSPVSARHHCCFVGHTRQRCSSPQRKHSLTRDVRLHLQKLEHELSENINTSVWEEKKQIQLKHEVATLRGQCAPHKPTHSNEFKCIKYAYSAVSISGTRGQPDTTYSNGVNSRPPDIVSLTTSKDMDLDATRTKIASNPLCDDTDYKSALDLMNQQIEQTDRLYEAKILEFTRKLQGYKRGLHANNLGITLPSAPVSASNIKRKNQSCHVCHVRQIWSA